ncbi:MAG: hypothetical protein JWP85_2100 [Rhodoglobus sp.]|nr:hypothetical protein [Rhodoglobus sp.]
MNELSYAEFIARRKAAVVVRGPVVDPQSLHPSLKPFQRDLVVRAARVGRFALWADTGLGKTRMQLEWARSVTDTALIIAPLAVADQTVSEARAIGIEARYVRSASEVAGPGIYVTNFEMVEHFPAELFGAVVLDESSILKQSDGKTRTLLIEHFRDVPFRLACSATPAPNDPEELTSQAEFLGQMDRNNMLAAYFVHDQDGWRMKGHAYAPMIEWMCSWAVAIRRPSDLGYEDDGYDLPGLTVTPALVDVEVEAAPDELFAVSIGGVSGRSTVRRASLAARVDRAVALVTAEPDEPWLLWCGLNDEADALAAALPGAVNLCGSLAVEEKARILRAFADGEIRVLITKPKIGALGLNWQHCARMIFVGLSDSYEAYYQCIRRCYRYGQARVVNVWIVLSEIEQQIAENVQRKESQANRIVVGMIRYLNEKLRDTA